jgi:predicted ATPase/DNA-binding SARP family transcriptional activator
VEPLRIRLFGYPQIECAGETVTVPRRKAVALLAYLAVTQSAHSRDALAALLWPEQESSRAYALLRNALWLLNQTPLEEWITSTRHMIGLRSESGLWIDVIEFRRALSPCRSHSHPGTTLCDRGAAQLEDAVALCQDRLLAGFVVDDSRSYEEWQYSEADVLAEELMGALDALADHFEQRGQLDRALAHAQRQLATQPFHEAAHRRAMRLRAATGDRAGALRQFDECARLLQQELSLAPCEETLALAEAIRTPAVGAAPVRTLQASGPTLLPQFRTPLFGREADVAQLLDLLARDDCRIVTVTGVGGSGKTRLAVEAARSAVGRFPGGVVFVPLAAVDSAAFAPAAIAAALDESRPHTSPSGEATPLDNLVGQLRGRPALLVLDNVEHLGRDVRWLQTLVDLPDGPRFLVTSRHQLDVEGEWIYPLEGLAYPREDSSSESARGCAAVRMFLQAAKRLDARFDPSEEELEAVGGICRLLQGLPLGVELAASWSRTMSCQAIAEEIARGLGFLSAKRALTPRRHRSLRAAFEGSWTLLDRPRREAFRALSVFRGGFSAEAAERIASVSLPTIASLVGKSLVRRSASDRFDMLETVRQFAAERLRVLPDERARLEARHSGYYLALLSSQESRLKGPEQKDALGVLGRESVNLHAAWRQAVSEDRFGDLRQSAMALFLLCDMTTRFAEGRELFREAADAALAASSLTRGYLRGLQAWFTNFFDAAESERLFRDSRLAVRNGPRDRDTAFVDVLAAFSRHDSAGLSTAELEEDLRFLEAEGYRWEFAAGAEAICGRYADGSLEKAVAAAKQSLDVRKELGDAWGLALGEYSLALCDLGLERFEEARAGFIHSAEIRRRLEIDPYGQMECLIQVARVERRLARPEAAAAALVEALGLAERVHQRLAAAHCHRVLAEIALEGDRRDEAATHLQAALTICEAFPASGEAASCHALAAQVACEGGRRS